MEARRKRITRRRISTPAIRAHMAKMAPKKSYIDLEGRVCTRCGWYKKWLDPDSGETNFHRHNGKFCIGGFRPECKVCTNEKRRRARGMGLGRESRRVKNEYSQ